MPSSICKKKKKKKRQMKAGGKINNSTWWQSKTGRLEERKKKSHFFPFHPLSHTEAVVIRERRGGERGRGREIVSVSVCV